MYNCELNMEERKIIAKEGEESICEANISVNDGIATVDFENGFKISLCSVCQGYLICRANGKCKKTS